jgi:hypothetical protein
MKCDGGTAIAVLSAFGGSMAAAAPAVADGPVGKGQYNIFNPTPVDSMRELSPDRPDKTESPYTVDAGHLQLEMDFANCTWDEDGGITAAADDWNPFSVFTMRS